MKNAERPVSPEIIDNDDVALVAVATAFTPLVNTSSELSVASIMIVWLPADGFVRLAAVSISISNVPSLLFLMETPSVTPNPMLLKRILFHCQNPEMLVKHHLVRMSVSSIILVGVPISVFVVIVALVWLARARISPGVFIVKPSPTASDTDASVTSKEIVSV